MTPLQRNLWKYLPAPSLLLSLLVAGCSSDSTQDSPVAEVSPCAPRNPESFPGGDTLIVGEVDPPCRLEIRDTGITLKGDPAGSRPDPGFRIVQDRTGRFYTTGAQGFSSQISVWDAAGEYLTSFGRPGEGPGEFSGSGLSLHVDGGNRLHVRDAGRWHLFDPDQTFVRTIQGNLMGGIEDFTALLDDGTILTPQLSAGGGGQSPHDFQIVDSTGVVVRFIAPVPSGTSAPAGPGAGSRLVAYAGGDSFWASPAPGTGYTLEKWSIEGELLRTVRREVPWFPASAPVAAPEGAGQSPPPAQITGMHLDPDGRLFLILATPTSDWRPIQPDEMMNASREEMAALMGAMFTGRIEVLDALSGRLLASETIPADQFPVDGAIRRTSLGFKAETGADLLPTVRIVEFGLVPK